MNTVTKQPTKRGSGSGASPRMVKEVVNKLKSIVNTLSAK